MAKLYNLAAMTVASTGTGTITLGSAATINGVLYLSFASAGVSNGETVAYSINDVGGSEVGTGTYTAAGTTLSRTPITSTNSNNAISMTAAAIVKISPAKADIANLRENNTFTATNVFGTAMTPQSGVTFVINANASGSLPSINSGFQPVAMIYGADLTRPALGIMGFNNSVGGEPSLLLLSARGTGATPTATHSGDFLGEVFAHPFDGTNFVYAAGSGFTFTAKEATTSTNAGQDIVVWTTPTGTASVIGNSTFNSNGGLSIGPQLSTITGFLTVNKNTSQTPVTWANPTPTMQLIGADSSSASVVLQGFQSGGGPGVAGLLARGTMASPTAVSTSDILAGISGYGYATSGGAGYVVNAGGGMQVMATESYTSTAAGSKLIFFATATGTASFGFVATMWGSGGFSVNTSSDPGAGMIYTNSASFMIRTKTSYSNGAGASTGTLTNAPAATNPTKWIPVDDNGTTRYIPAW